jgi:hypothetical protein
LWSRRVGIVVILLSGTVARFETKIEIKDRDKRFETEIEIKDSQLYASRYNGD